MSESDIVDLVFVLEGRAVAEDHADLLHQALCAVLPWLADAADVGVHPLHRLSPGQGERYLSRHSRLMLRLPAVRVEAARGLSGAELELGGTVRVGAASVRALRSAPVLYSHFVHVDEADEAAFLAACRALLAAMGVEGHLVAGKAQRMNVAGTARAGYSLMLHGLDAEASLRLQRRGLGEERKRGCGVFVPHKSVAAVGT